jgi:lysozyme
MTPEDRALLNTIRYAEGTWRGGSNEGYRVMFGGGLADPVANKGRHPDRVIDGGRYASAAAGAYQFMPQTWGGAIKAIGARPDQFFDPAVQDKAAMHLVRQRLGDTRLGEGLTAEVTNKLAPEWASFPMLDGNSRYGQPVKKLGDLDRFYREQLASLRAGGTGETPTATSPVATPAAVAPAATGPGIDWAALAGFGTAAAGVAGGAAIMSATRPNPKSGLGGLSDLAKAGDDAMAAQGGRMAGNDRVLAYLQQVGQEMDAAAQSDPYVTKLKSMIPDTPTPGVVAPQQVSSASTPGPTPVADGIPGSIDARQLVMGLQDEGLTVRELKGFGDGRVGRHSHGSRHYDPINRVSGLGGAADLTVQQGSRLLAGKPDSEWRAVTRYKGELLADALGGVGPGVLHPGNDRSHAEHVHLPLAQDAQGRVRLNPNMGQSARQLMMRILGRGRA